MIVVFELNNRTYDVFVGQGWKNWSRFQVKGKTLVLVAGQALSKGDYDTVRGSIVK